MTFYLKDTKGHQLEIAKLFYRIKTLEKYFLICGGKVKSTLILINSFSLSKPCLNTVDFMSAYPAYQYILLALF